MSIQIFYSITTKPHRVIDAVIFYLLFFAVLHEETSAAFIRENKFSIFYNTVHQYNQSYKVYATNMMFRLLL